MSQNAKNVTVTAEQIENINQWIPAHFRFGSWEHCFYCGTEPTTQDHVIPWSFVNVERKHMGSSKGVKTPCCSECNSILSDHFFDTLHERCDAANKRLRRRYSKYMHMEAWDEWETKQLHGGLRDYVVSQQTERAKAVERVGWQYTQKFTEMFDDAYRKAKDEFPKNTWLHNLLKPHWAL